MTLLPAEVLSFETVIVGALSDSNAVRRAAEETFQRTKQQHPDQYVTALTLLLQSDRQQAVREFAAVMLRQALVLNSLTAIAAKEQANGAESPSSSQPSPTSKDIFPRLSPSTVQLLQTGLLQLIDAEQPRAIRKKSIDAIAALAARTLPSQQWPDFLPAFLAAMKSPTPQHRETVLELIEKLCDTVDIALLTPHIAQMRGVLVESLQSSEAALRLSALQALISLLLCLDSSEVKSMQDAIPLMFNALHAAYTTLDDGILTSATTVLASLIKAHPSLVRPHLSAVTQLMVAIVKDERLDEESRRSAMEFLITLAEAGKGMIRKQAEFGRLVIPLSFTLLCDGVDEDDREWRAQESEHDEVDGEENAGMGAESAGRLAEALGGKVYVATVIPLIQSNLSSAQWVHRHAALCVLSAMSEYAQEAVEPLLPTFVTLVLPYLRDSAPRVVDAVLGCLQQMVVSYSPTFQDRYHEQVVPALMSQLTPQQLPRIIAMTCGTLIEFTREADAAILTQYAGDLLNLLSQLIQLPSLPVKERTLMVISSLALSMQADFIPYYPTFYPGIKHLVMHAPPASGELRHKAIECLGALADAVGHDVFMPEAHHCMSVLTQLQQQDDTLLSYVSQAEARIAKAMGAEFAPYLPHVIPSLLKSAAITDEYAVISGDEVSALEGQDGYVTKSVDFADGQKLKITMNQTLFDEKAIAVNMLYSYAETLKGGFLPYVAQTATVVLPLMTYRFHESVRIAAVSLAPALVRSTAEGMAGRPAEEREAAVRELFGRMLPVFIACTEQELHLDNLCGIVDAFGDAVALMGCAMSEAELNTLTAAIKRLSVESIRRMEAREERRAAEDYDEEEETAIAGENEHDDEFLGYLYELMVACIKQNGAAFLPHYHAHLHPVFAPLLTHSNTSLVVTALCVIAQVVNDLPLPAPLQVSYCDALFPVCMAHAVDEELDPRQSAMYGLGACCQCMGERFLPVLPAAVRVILQVIHDPHSKDEGAAPATDCAIASLEKIVAQCSASMTPHERARLLGEWTDALPSVGDVGEAQLTHDKLCGYVEREDVAVLGERGERVEKILLVFGSLLESEYLSEEGSGRVAALLRRWKGKLGEQQWGAVLGKMDDEDRQSVEKALASVQQ